MRRPFTITSAVTFLGLVTLSAAVQVQNRDTFGANPVWHLGVIVRNIETSARAYADLLGVPVPAVSNPASGPRVPFPSTFKGDRAAYVKSAMIGYSDFAIELQEPVGGASPWRDYLDTYGEGPFHLGFGVTNIGASVAYLEQHGGTVVVGGTPGAEYAYVSFKPQLGLMIEVGKAREATAKNLPPTSFGSNATSRIAVVQSDVEKAAAFFMELFGIDSPPIRTNSAGMLHYPTASDDAPAGVVKFADRFRLNGVSVELQQPLTASSPWRAALDKRGPSIFYLGFVVKDVPASIDYLVKKGGKVVLSTTNNRVTFVDMPSPLSLKIGVFRDGGAPPNGAERGRGN